MNIFVLTGAGVSAESGLGTFRDTTGLWTRFDPMKLATPGAFARNPDEVHTFYNLRRRNLLEASPNPAHVALARLEAELGKRKGRLFLVTQNIDDLHERAGSQCVTHMHGELLKARCTACDAVDPCIDDLGVDDRCPHCGQPGSLRPHVVWFGEYPLHMAAIDEALQNTDLFVSIGTSGSVYPAAGFVKQAKDQGIRACEINLEPSDNAALFDEAYYGPASQAVTGWVEKIFEVVTPAR